MQIKREKPIVVVSASVMRDVMRAYRLRSAQPFHKKRHPRSMKGK